MLTPSSPIPTPFSNATTNTAKAATVEATARTAFREQMRLASDQETQVANNAATLAAARQQAADVPDPMTSLSTVAVAGAMNSLPAALNMMRSIALASADGTLTEADRQALQSEYAQLSAKVVSTVGSVGAGEQAQTSTSRDADAQNASPREDGDDRRSTLTQTMEVPKETVQYMPVERTTTVQRQTLVADGHGPQKDPRVDFRTHELHVGTDSYEPASVRQSFEHSTEPATLGRIETHAETQHSFVAQAAQITQFVQVAQTEQIPPIVAVA
jgi:flagellin-like hook-associated protein FlgL